MITEILAGLKENIASLLGLNRSNSQPEESITSLEARTDLSKAECPVCGDGFKPEELSDICTCGGCNTAYHKSCWEYNEGCGIFGCLEMANNRSDKKTYPKWELMKRVLTTDNTATTTLCPEYSEPTHLIVLKYNQKWNGKSYNYACVYVSLDQMPLTPAERSARKLITKILDETENWRDEEENPIQNLFNGTYIKAIYSSETRKRVALTREKEELFLAALMRRNEFYNAIYRAKARLYSFKTIDFKQMHERFPYNHRYTGIPYTSPEEILQRINAVKAAEEKLKKKAAVAQLTVYS